MNVSFTQEQKLELLAKFKALETLQEKLLFWQNEIGQNYIKFLVFMDGTDNLSQELNEYYGNLLEFRIKPKASEYEDYNRWVLEMYSLFVGSFNPKKQLQSLSKRIKDFEERSKEILFNRKEFIEKEIEKVKLEVEERSKEVPLSFTNTHQFFKHTFEKIYYGGEEESYSDRFYDILDLVATHDAGVYANYLDYLVDELSRAGKNTAKRTREIGLNQQLLLLDYLGVIEQLNHPDTSKRAELLSLLVNKSYQNVRTVLTYYTKLKYSKVSKEKEDIRNDLQEVMKLLEAQGLSDLAAKVQMDISKLDK